MWALGDESNQYHYYNPYERMYQPTGIIVQSSGIVAHLLTGLDLSW